LFLFVGRLEYATKRERKRSDETDEGTMGGEDRLSVPVGLLPSRTAS